MEENFESQSPTSTFHHRAVIILVAIVFLGALGYGLWGYSPFFLDYFKENSASVTSGYYVVDSAYARARVETYSSHSGTKVTKGTLSVLSGSAQVAHGGLESMSFELDMNSLDIYSHDAAKNTLARDFLRSSSVFNTSQHPRITLSALSQDSDSSQVVFDGNAVLDAEVYILGVPHKVKIPVSVVESAEGQLSLKTRISLPTVLGEFSLLPFFLGIDQGVTDTFDIVVEMTGTRKAIF